MSSEECIQLSLPLNSAYVSAARLTSSSVANRLRFDTDEIEDIKAAVSESCTYIIKSQCDQAENFVVRFYTSVDLLKVEIRAAGCQNIDNDEMSLTVIKALMDDVTIKKVNNETTITMTKYHQSNRFTIE
ncbi:MAG: ATP-binding protein [Clostridiales bacterium]|nr:ATP-binding protein [Clostridiales bacterium]